MNSNYSYQEEDIRQKILRAKAGDENAFEEVYRDLYTPIFRYIYSRLRNKQDAEDITQTVFMRVWKILPEWNESHTSPTAFFFHSARNIIIDTFRKKSHQEIISDEVVTYQIEYESQATVEEDPETIQNIKTLIKNLSEEQQEILTLLYTNNLSYREIADITRKKEDAIRQTHSRAIKKLRTLYEKTND